MTSPAPIVVEGILDPAPFAHGIRAGRTLRSSAISACDTHGNLPGDGDLSKQAGRIYDYLTGILERAGAGWEDVVKINHYHASPGPSSAEWRSLQAVLAQYVRTETIAGMDLCVGTAFPGCRLQVEVIAEIGGERRILGHPLQGIGLPWAEGIRVGDRAYLSGRRCFGAGHHAPNTLANQTATIYGGFQHLLNDAGLSCRNIVRVRQFICDEEVDFNGVRAGRERFVPAGYFTSTSVAIPATSPPNADDAWLLAVELEAEEGVKIAVSTSGAVDTPGVPHLVRIGDRLHLQAVIANDSSGAILHPGDIEEQTRHVLNSLGAVLSAAGGSWKNVTYSRVFCRHAEHLDIVGRLEGERAQGVRYARAALVSGFFDPAVLVEIELVASLS